MNPPWPQTSRPGAAHAFTAHDLMREILQMTTQRWTDPLTFAKLATTAGFQSAVARIYFLTQLKERVRMFPLKLFVNPESRDKLLEALQTALDQEISREEMS